MSKTFDDWNVVKKDLDSKVLLPSFKEREIWWCSIGINIGFEMDGKHEVFHRPVLVIRKFNKSTFYGLPLSSKIKDNEFYHQFVVKGQVSSALLTQLRVFDSKRLTRKIGYIEQEKFEEIKTQLAKTLKIRNPS